MSENKKLHLAFIGAGNMAQAMIAGLLRTGDETFTLGISSRTRAKCEPLAASGVTVFETNADAARWADMIVLAVKPQQYETVLSDLRNAGIGAGKVFVSIAAGVSCASVCRQLGAEVPVVRAMPNTPMLMGMGSTAISRNALVTDDVFAVAERIFAASGKTMVLEEDRMNAVIAATGSAPAYLYLIIKAINDEARREGVDAPALLENICQMVRGAAEMAEHSPDNLDTLIKKVCSPGGTTERAMNVLYERGLPGILAEAMQACTDRAEELGRQY
ncbi:MAG: pyrroline-5-carboxylate reductase [Clostridia bacterium]|nr:pyrroline-5-carboxylate reductase [Clostridia bacterium]